VRSILAMMKLSRSQRLGLLVALLALIGLAVASVVSRDVLLFNHSPSVPVGFYVRINAAPAIGSFVTVRARDVAPHEAAARHYDKAGDRFIKRVAAIAGQEVCSEGRMLRIDGREVAAVLISDQRTIPSGWVGCRILAADEILLLGDSEDSFDGRYWGPINARLIEGVWRLV
jgi:type IV secretory pathway protease TraF